MNGSAQHRAAGRVEGVASISVYDVYQSNGVIQVIDKVLLPKM